MSQLTTVQVPDVAGPSREQIIAAMSELTTGCRDIVMPLLADCVRRLDKPDNADYELCQRLVSARGMIDIHLRDMGINS